MITIWPLFEENDKKIYFSANNTLCLQILKKILSSNISCGLTLIPSFENNVINHKFRDEITWRFQNFKGVIADDWELISNVIPHFAGMSLLIHTGLELMNNSKGTQKIFK